MKTFKTPKGTELPLMDLKGKDYLQVAYRLIWFREAYPEGRIETERISDSPDQVTYRATISVEHPAYGYIKLANADKTLKIKNTTDYEKAETGAIGRALALAGFGTQFATQDIDEEEELADAPLEKKSTPKVSTDPMEYKMEYGLNKGKRLGDMTEAELKNYIQYFEIPSKTNTRIRQEFQLVVTYFGNFELLGGKNG